MNLQDIEGKKPIPTGYILCISRTFFKWRNYGDEELVSDIQGVKDRSDQRGERLCL